MAAVKLTEKQRRYLRGLAHPLKPVILIGNAGVSPGVVAETQRALHDHELIKVKLVADDRDSKKALTEAICADHKAELVQSVGHVLLLFRKSKTPDPRLSNLLR